MPDAAGLENNSTSTKKPTAWMIGVFFLMYFFLFFFVDIYLVVNNISLDYFRNDSLWSSFSPKMKFLFNLMISFITFKYILLFLFLYLKLKNMESFREVIARNTFLDCVSFQAVLVYLLIEANQLFWIVLIAISIVVIGLNAYLIQKNIYKINYNRLRTIACFNSAFALLIIFVVFPHFQRH
jgi:hypothetical protein